MKSKIKGLYKFIFVIGIITVIALILMIPAVSRQAEKVTGIAASKIRNTAADVVSIAVAIMLISFGVAALAAVPWVGVILIGVGIGLLAYTLWPLLSRGSSGSGSMNGNYLQKVA